MERSYSVAQPAKAQLRGQAIIGSSPMFQPNARTGPNPLSSRKSNRGAVGSHMGKGAGPGPSSVVPVGSPCASLPPPLMLIVLAVASRGVKMFRGGWFHNHCQQLFVNYGSLNHPTEDHTIYQSSCFCLWFDGLLVLGSPLDNSADDEAGVPLLGATGPMGFPKVMDCALDLKRREESCSPRIIFLYCLTALISLGV